jgi:hypothetical protein
MTLAHAKAEELGADSAIRRSFSDDFSPARTARTVSDTDTKTTAAMPAETRMATEISHATSTKRGPSERHLCVLAPGRPERGFG